MPKCVFSTPRPVERLWAGAAMGREIGARTLAANRAVSGPARKSPMGVPILEARPMGAA